MFGGYCCILCSLLEVWLVVCSWFGVLVIVLLLGGVV